ncbi:MAG: WD40 repeat domain-containing protein [Rhizonema sp. PD37]|nr:WD40 repeat domain-containing protein [Rhizonema sp. PD37]
MRLQLTAHKGSIDSLAFSANGQTLVSGSSDGTIKIWHCD